MSWTVLLLLGVEERQRRGFSLVGLSASVRPRQLWISVGVDSHFECQTLS